MTDYFTLLEQPRAAWLDSAALKEAYHRKTLQAHPDSAGREASDFAELNTAYQTLQDPKRRLHHLLSLQNQVPSPNKIAPADLQELFLQIGTLNQNAAGLIGRLRSASNPLSKSLLKAEIVGVQNELSRLRDKVRELHAGAEGILRETGIRQIEDISNLYQRFAYLGRWSAQLDELAFQLTL